MNSTLDWVKCLLESKMYHLFVKYYKSRILSVSESACSIVVYIIRYSEYHGEYRTLILRYASWLKKKAAHSRVFLSCVRPRGEVHKSVCTLEYTRVPRYQIQAIIVKFCTCMVYPYIF